MSSVALYMRISLDDDNHSESESIQNQRGLLRAYVAANPELSAGEVLEFADDGWSGTNFERPQVKALLDLARRGGVRNILVKDLSRWGRNYSEVSEYLDQIFPFLGIRFISVNDHYDSNDHRGTTAPMDVAFSSIMHDVYSKELSVKVKQAHTAKALKGEYVCGTTPFGYLRSTEKKNILVVDEVAAVTIRRIFDLACEGMNTTNIAATLNADNVDTAIAHRKRLGRSTLGMKPIKGQSHWSNVQIIRILSDERYTGTMVSFKTKKVSPGSKKQLKRPESEWVRVPGAHEAIISAEQFAEANAKMRTNKKSPRGISPDRSPYAGKIFCGHCGRAMPQMSCQNPYHFCKGVKLNRGQGCFGGKVLNVKIKERVLTAVQAEVGKMPVERKPQISVESSPANRADLVAKLKKLTAQIATLERRHISSFEDFADGKLGKDEYLVAKEANSAALADAQNRVRELDRQLATVNDEAVGCTQSESLVQRVLDTGDVSGEVFSLVERIVIFDDERVEIHFALSIA